MGKTYYLKKMIRRSVIPCVIIDTLGEYQDLAVLAPAVSPLDLSNFKTRFRPANQNEFDMICRTIVKRYYRYGLNFMVEEADQWVGSHKITHDFLRLLYESRHQNINVYLCVHSPVDMNAKIRNISHRFLIWNLTEYNYLQYFGRIDPALPDRIRALSEGEYVELPL